MGLLRGSLSAYTGNPHRNPKESDNIYSSNAISNNNTVMLTFRIHFCQHMSNSFASIRPSWKKIEEHNQKSMRLANA